MIFSNNSSNNLLLLIISLLVICTLRSNSSTLALATSYHGNNHLGGGGGGTILVTGGAGYIGSHTCLELLLGDSNNDSRVVVIDTLDNSSEESLLRVKKLTGLCSDDDRLVFRNCDIRCSEGLDRVLDEFEDIDSCIHFAGK